MHHFLRLGMTFQHNIHKLRTYIDAPAEVLKSLPLGFLEQQFGIVDRSLLPTNKSVRIPSDVSCAVAYSPMEF